VIGTDCIGKFNYHVIMAPPTPNTSKSNWPPRYNWNIVESGIDHHQTNKQT
jgi:hypothetical protein